MSYEIASEIKKLEKLGARISVKSRIPGEKNKSAILDDTTNFLSPEKDGLILQNNGQGAAFALVAETLNDPKIAVVIVNGQSREKEVSLLSSVKEENGWKFFVRLVSTWPVQGGYSTKPQDNGLRLVFAKYGKLRIFSVAVVSRLYDEEQGAYHFLVIQEMYKAKLYRDEKGKIVAEDDIVTSAEEYPGFNIWSAMQGLVDQMISPAERNKLPLLKSRRKTTPSPGLELGENEAEVIFFDINKGFGFARVADGRGIYFNWQNSASEERLPYFFGGQEVVYDEIRTTDHGEQLIGVKDI